jgi:hypothetical protein
VRLLGLESENKKDCISINNDHYGRLIIIPFMTQQKILQNQAEIAAVVDDRRPNYAMHRPQVITDQVGVPWFGTMDLSIHEWRVL